MPSGDELGGIIRASSISKQKVKRHSLPVDSIRNEHTVVEESSRWCPPAAKSVTSAERTHFALVEDHCTLRPSPNRSTENDEEPLTKCRNLWSRR